MEGFLCCFSLILTLGPLQSRHVSACVQRNFQLPFVTRSSLGKEATSGQCGPTTARGPCHQSNPKQQQQQKTWSGPPRGWVTWIGWSFWSLWPSWTSCYPPLYKIIKFMLWLQRKFLRSEENQIVNSMQSSKEEKTAALQRAVSKN